MSQQAIGMIETRGLVALVEATDSMLKSANVELAGPITQVGNAMVTVRSATTAAPATQAFYAGAQRVGQAPLDGVVTYASADGARHAIEHAPGG